MMHLLLDGFHKSDASISQNNVPGRPVLKQEDDWTVHRRRAGGSEFTSKERSAEQHGAKARLEYQNGSTCERGETGRRRSTQD